MDRLERFLAEEVDTDAIDRDGKIPPAVDRRAWPSSAPSG